MILTVGEVAAIALLRPAIPLAGEDTAAADRLEPEPQAADTGEQVDKAESRRT